MGLGLGMEQSYTPGVVQDLRSSIGYWLHNVYVIQEGVCQEYIFLSSAQSRWSQERFIACSKQQGDKSTVI